MWESFFVIPCPGKCLIIEITLFYERIKWSKPLKRRVYLESASGLNGEIYRLVSAEKREYEVMGLMKQSGWKHKAALCMS